MKVLKWYSKNNARLILTIVHDKSIIGESFQTVPDEHCLIFFIFGDKNDENCN